MNSIIEEVEKRKFVLNKVIASRERQLKKVPDGRLRISAGKFYQVVEGKSPSGHYIPKGKEKLKRDLAQKDYDKDVLDLAQTELKALNNGKIYTGRCFEDVYSELQPLRRELVVPAALPDDLFISRWLSRPYEKMGFDDGAPFYACESGLRVRSKSELIIAQRLEKYNIPFLYEVPVEIHTRTFRPDFLVLKMPQRKEIFWEHLGMMDSEDYSNKNTWKLIEYSHGRLVIGDNLIITMETGAVPLNTDYIDQIIKANFL